ncbi:MAG: class I SAM-dependent methyltransferase [Deltaproteobacteria bacterium]|nr:class I SAM-dependent methyltransferase [Deltaproteobacteria bacterium]
MLDVGCGTGFRAAQFPGSTYLGIDPSTSETNCGVAFVQGIAECMPLHSNFFDLVLCIDVLDHVISPEYALAEILRVIKPGGYLYLMVGNTEDEMFYLHKQSRQMFGIREFRAHLHQFNASFFQERLSPMFSRFETIRSKGFLFVHAQEKVKGNGL